MQVFLICFKFADSAEKYCIEIKDSDSEDDTDSSVSPEDDIAEQPSNPIYLQVLRKYFGYTDFRP